MPERIVSNKSKICLMKFFLETGRKEAKKEERAGKKKELDLMWGKNVITFPKMYESHSY